MILLLICALILRELRNLASILPDLELTAQNGMSMLSDWLLGLIHRLPDGIHTILERNITGFFSGGSELLDKAVRYVLGLASAILSHVPDSALMLGTAVISSFMISAKLPRIKLWFQEKFPKQRLQPLLDGLKRMRAAVGGWLKAQVKLSAVTWLILTLGFFLLRIPYAPLWAAVVSLVDAFPILGTGAILLPWSLLSFVQENAARGIGLLGIYAVVSVTRSVLEPKLVGKQLGLDPLLTLAALYAGYRLWGLGGMILAPLLAVTVRNLIPDSRTA
jgi:sporulation integral membrane protein YtvI